MFAPKLWAWISSLNSMKHVQFPWIKVLCVSNNAFYAPLKTFQDKKELFEIKKIFYQIFI